MLENNKLKQEELEETDNDKERGTWTGRFDFLLACLGTAVGLGNVWRFPYLCYKNGGGAFVIPYIVMVLVVGLPVFFLELGLGQYSALGPIKVYANIAPMCKGLGYAMILAAAIVAIYYNMIIAWTLFYFFDSFRSDVDWKYCSHSFNTDMCFSDFDFRKCKSDNETNVFVNRLCYNSTYAEMYNLTDIPVDSRISAPEEYLNLYMLGKSEGLHEMGNIRWQLLLSLLGAWVIVVLCLIKGIKTSGRVVYFTATFPYVILFILFIRGVTLEGALDGIKFYVIPDFEKLKDINVWKDAAIQVFYSFSIGGGGMMTYASYNKFSNNFVKDAWIIGIGDAVTSLFSGFVVFSMVGFMASQLNKPVDAVIQSGTGLAFIAYPDGISRMPLSTLWALLFFFMLFLLGIDSQFAVTETIITFIFDQFPRTRSRKPLVVIAVGSVLFLLGIPLTMNGGIYILELMDNYAAGWPYLLIGLLECLIVSYVYGIENFLDDVRNMTGWEPGRWTRTHLMASIMTITPVLIGGLLLLGWVYYEPLKLGTYTYPLWGNSIGWAMAIIPMLVIPVFFFHTICAKHRNLTFRQRMRLLASPTEKWRENAKRHDKATAVRVIYPLTDNRARSKLENSAYDNPALNYITNEHDSRL